MGFVQPKILLEAIQASFKAHEMQFTPKIL